MENQNLSGHSAQKTITVNCYVEVHDVKKDMKYTIRLVPPANVNITSKWISVNSPLGKSLIGRRTGDTVTWDAPTEKHTLRILRVRQK